MTTRDVSAQSDIAKSFTIRPKDTDGSFNRRPSTFRDTIAKGSKYEPEKGMSTTPLPVSDLYNLTRQFGGTDGIIG